MIIVTNGDSRFSQDVVRALLKRVPAGELAVTARDPERLSALSGKGVAVRRQDFADTAVTAAALAGADRVLSAPPPGWSQLDATGAAVADALAGVAALLGGGAPQIVHMGFINAHVTALSWHVTMDAQIRGGGIPYTVLRANLHSEALLPAVRLALETDAFVSALESRIVAPASREDYAEAAAIVLTEDGHENQVYELSGIGLTPLGLASVASMIADREITIREVDERNVIAEVIDLGGSPAEATELADLYAAGRRGEFAAEGEDLDQLLKHPHRSNVEALSAALIALDR